MDPTGRYPLDPEVARLVPPDAVPAEPRCAWFGRCGGCQLQHLDASTQAAVKARIVEGRLAGHGVALPGRPRVHEAREPWGWRHKVELAARVAGGRGLLGFNPRGVRATIEPDGCPVLAPLLDRLVRLFREDLRDRADLAAHLHSVSLRASRSRGVAFATLFSRRPDARSFAALVERIGRIGPELIGGGHLGDGRAEVTGSDRLSETVLGCEVRFVPWAFFQANPGQLEVLASRVVELAAPGPDDRVLDLYAGVGLYSLLLAQRAGRVVGVDDSTAAIACAVENGASQGASNARFERCRAERFVETGQADLLGAGVVVVNPPRPGLAPGVVRWLCRPGPRPARVVYVSCEPASLARDARILVDHGFALADLEIVDMFPQTVHVETVARFVKRTARP